MNSLFSDPAFWSRIQFAFTITFHYLFPQLTMGLAWFLVYWKWRALRTGDEKYGSSAESVGSTWGLGSGSTRGFSLPPSPSPRPVRLRAR